MKQSQRLKEANRKGLWSVQTMHTFRSEVCLVKGRASLGTGYCVSVCAYVHALVRKCACVHVCVCTESTDLHLQIKNNIRVWTPGTDSETNKLKVQTWNEINIESRFRTHACPYPLQRVSLPSRGNRSVSENHPTGPVPFKPDQTGYIWHWMYDFMLTDLTLTSHNTVRTWHLYED